MKPPRAEFLSTLIEETDRRIVLNVLQAESPRDVAVLIVSLPTQQGAGLLSRMTPNRRIEVAEAITSLDGMQVEEIESIFARVEERIKEATEGTVLFEEGANLLAGLLAKMDVNLQEDVLTALNERQPETSAEVRERLLDFGELHFLDDASVRLLLDNLELHTLAIALKSATSEVKGRFVGCMSEKEAELLEAEIANLAQEHILASPQIQRVIVDTVRRFQAQGMVQFQKESPMSAR